LYLSGESHPKLEIKHFRDNPSYGSWFSLSFENQKFRKILPKIQKLLTSFNFFVNSSHTKNETKHALNDKSDCSELFLIGYTAKNISEKSSFTNSKNLKYF